MKIGTMINSNLLLLLVATLFGERAAFAFTSGPAVASRPFSSSLASATTEAAETTAEIEGTPLKKRDRYVATNRFAVRRDQQAKFEARWANRKSRLATLQGFKWFHLMRRVNLNDDGTCSYDQGESDEDAMENYVSFTIWNKKSDFSAWRSGEAFKEAHGGTSIGAFLKTMMSSALVLRGAPRPAFYDGLLPEVSPDSISETPTVDGWRDVQADGVTTLPAECFVEMKKHYVPYGNAAAAFEKAFSEKAPSAKEADGFLTRILLRRDARAKG